MKNLEIGKIYKDKRNTGDVVVIVDYQMGRYTAFEMDYNEEKADYEATCILRYITNNEAQHYKEV